MLLAGHYALCADRMFGIEGALCRLVGNQLDARHQAGITYLSNQRVIGQLGQTRFKQRSDGPHLAANIHALVNLDRLDAERTAERMAAIGIAVAESADLFRLRLHGFIHVVRHHHRAERRIG